LLGNKANAYKKLPSIVELRRVSEPKRGDAGRSLKLSFDKRSTGWCGYYTLLNQIDGDYFDLSEYKELRFWVRGRSGKENFQVGMSDKSWLTIGDSVKAGSVNDFLPRGVTKRWQEVVIPLAKFGKLEWSKMGSIVFNFHEVGRGAIYLEDLQLIRKSEADLLEEWEEGS